MAALVNQENERSQGTPVSFLDVIACAFAAVILLIVILPVGMVAIQPEENDDSEAFGRLLFEASALDQVIASLRSELGRTRKLTSDINSGILSSAQASQKVREAIVETRQGIEATNSQAKALERSADILTSARPTSLITQDLPVQVAGIPVDSEYVAFVVDTSGSMQTFWDDVVKEVEHVLALYPELKGFQFLNDQADFLFPGIKSRWIPDSPYSRKRAAKLMRRWRSFSASSPEKGITTAVRLLFRSNIKMAIFVIGDNYNGREFDSFLRKIDAVVKQRKVANGALRIHVIGFYEPHMSDPWNFATLMRELSRQHRGVFLALEAKQQNLGFPFPGL